MRCAPASWPTPNHRAVPMPASKGLCRPRCAALPTPRKSWALPLTFTLTATRRPDVGDYHDRPLPSTLQRGKSRRRMPTTKGAPKQGKLNTRAPRTYGVVSVQRGVDGREARGAVWAGQTARTLAWACAHARMGLGPALVCTLNGEILQIWPNPAVCVGFAGVGCASEPPHPKGSAS